MNKDRTIPGTLSSRGMREQLAHRTEPAFANAAAAIDKLKDLYVALATLHDTPDPAFSKEHRALRYAKQLETARKSALAAATGALEQLEALGAAVKDRASKAARLDTRLAPDQEAEVRAALRGMTQKQRTEAITAAAERGEGWFVNLVRFAPAPEVTIGPHSAPPIEALVEMLLRRAAPEYEQDMEDIDSALTYVTLAGEAFGKHTNEMRDPALESRGHEQSAALQAAEAQLRG